MGVLPGAPYLPYMVFLNYTILGQQGGEGEVKEKDEKSGKIRDEEDRSVNDSKRLSQLLQGSSRPMKLK